MSSLNTENEFAHKFNQDIDALLTNINEVQADLIRKQLITILCNFSLHYSYKEKDIYFGLAIYLWYLEARSKDNGINKTRSEWLDLAVDFCMYQYKFLWVIPRRTRKEYRFLIQKLYLECHPE